MTTMTLNQVPTETSPRNFVINSVDWLTQAIRTLDSWRQRQKSRAQFAGIDMRTLRDSGISEAQRFIEGNKPFWED